jgi:hypothetical protein
MRPCIIRMVSSHKQGTWKKPKPMIVLQRYTAAFYRARSFAALRMTRPWENTPTLTPTPTLNCVLFFWASKRKVRYPARCLYARVFESYGAIYQPISIRLNIRVFKCHRAAVESFIFLITRVAPGAINVSPQRG